MATLEVTAFDESGEVLDFMRSVMRGEATGDLPSKVRAADFLGRHYGLWDGRGLFADGAGPVVIFGEDKLE